MFFIFRGGVGGGSSIQCDRLANGDALLEGQQSLTARPQELLFKDFNLGLTPSPDRILDSTHLQNPVRFAVDGFFPPAFLVVIGIRKTPARGTGIATGTAQQGQQAESRQ